MSGARPLPRAARGLSNHKEMLNFERIEAVSDEMRALIEPSWCTSCQKS
jgi:hypothetical protein